MLVLQRILKILFLHRPSLTRPDGLLDVGLSLFKLFLNIRRASITIHSTFVCPCSLCLPASFVIQHKTFTSKHQLSNEVHACMGGVVGETIYVARLVTVVTA